MHQLRKLMGRLLDNMLFQIRSVKSPGFCKCLLCIKLSGAVIDVDCLWVTLKRRIDNAGLKHLAAESKYSVGNLYNEA